MMNTEDLQTIEQELSIRLPEYYKQYMLDYPLDSLSEFEDYDFFSDSGKLITENKHSYNGFYGKPVNKKYFRIGNNGLGNYYFIDLEKDGGVICYFRTDQSFYLIANSLSEYENKLKDGTHEENLGNENYKCTDLRK
jgi:hypothetical protein